MRLTLFFVRSLSYWSIISKYGKEFIREHSGLPLLLTTILLFAIGFPFVLRSMAAYTKAKQACYNIYEQQFQMARFIRENYDGKPIAANDIGALSYYTESPVVDLWGLGSIEVARGKKERRWTPEFLADLVKRKQVKVAIVYDEWFDPTLLANWKKVATWQIVNNVICGGEVVTFYATELEGGTELKKKLVGYQTNLPSDVKVFYYE